MADDQHTPPGQGSGFLQRRPHVDVGKGAILAGAELGGGGRGVGRQDVLAAGPGGDDLDRHALGDQQHAAGRVPAHGVQAQGHAPAVAEQERPGQFDDLGRENRIGVVDRAKLGHQQARIPVPGHVSQ